PQLLVEEEGERRPEHDLDRHAREGEDGGVLDRLPEDAVVNELAVVVEADPAPGVLLGVVVLERADEARDERIDREREQVEDAGSEQEKGFSASLGRSGAEGPGRGGNGSFPRG